MTIININVPNPVVTGIAKELDSTRLYLAAYLKLETPADPMALLTEIAKPRHQRGILWIAIVRKVHAAGVLPGVLPMELGKKSA